MGLCLYYLRGGNITIISSMRRVCIFNAVIGHFGFTGLGFFFLGLCTGFLAFCVRIGFCMCFCVTGL